VDLVVPVHRCLAFTAGGLALGVEATGQVGDGLFKAVRDGREVLLIVADERRGAFGGESVGKVKSAGSQGFFTSSASIFQGSP
jgi:hypothetical protein